jgi:hypothetical protein
MPFPLAHPAAVLPLRRCCPRQLNFPALVIGSLTPDLGYAFGNLHVDWFSHRFWAGSLGFCLPAGLVLVAAFYSLRRPMVGILPARYQQALLPLCDRGAGSPVRIVVSLLIGAWTHILLDSVTHEDGWMVEHLPGLRRLLPSFGKEPLPVYDLLYAACTFFGVAWLAHSYLRWLDRIALASRPSRPAGSLCWSLPLAASILVLSLVSRGPHRWIGVITGGIAALMLVLGFLAATGRNLTPGSHCGQPLRPKTPDPRRDT